MEFAKIFITLAALINPFGAIPAFIGLTQGQSSLERRRTARTAALATVLVITVTALAGQYLLAGFGITVPSLQVGGGVLLFIVAISMFNAQPAPSRTTPEETEACYVRLCIPVKARLDILYLRRRSFCLDLQILAKTCAGLLKSR